MGIETCIGLTGTALVNCLVTGGGTTGIGGLPTLPPSGTIGTLLSCQSQFPNPILAQICVNQNGGNPCNADALAQIALTGKISLYEKNKLFKKKKTFLI